MPPSDWIVWTSGLSCAIGGVIPLLRSHAGEPSPYVHGFAAGTLLGAGLLVLIPEAAPVLGSQLGVAVLLGFLVLYVFDRWLLTAEKSHGHDHAEAGHAHHVGALAVAGFSVHTLADGAALGVASASPKLGVPVFLGILFHEIPAQFVFSRLLIASGVKRVWVFLAVAGLAIGMIGATYVARRFSETFDPSLISFCLAASAGMFLFIATAELLPREHRGTHGSASSFAFFAGTLVAYAGSYFADKA